MSRTAPGIEVGKSQTDAFVGAFFDELARAGVRHVCVSPGSRSAPLAVAAFQSPALRCWSHVDERSAAFFALGAAKATREPVAVVCTSGTAAANYLPAVLESHHAGVPLLVFTADRPPELREWGAGQTVDQLKLFGTAVRWFVELPPLDGARPADDGFVPLLRYARALACRAVDVARGGWPGPVHLNWPLREPLEPGGRVPLTATAGEAALAQTTEAARVEVVRPATAPSALQVQALVERAQASPKGIIACGPMDASDSLAAAIADLARATGWPVLADPTSQMRCGPHVVDAPIVGCGDLLLRDSGFASTHAPELVLRFGGSPVSKALRLWLEASPPEQLILVDGDAGWNDPSHLASDVLRVDPEALCRALVDGLGVRRGLRHTSAWTEDFVGAEHAAATAVSGAFDADTARGEPRAVRELCAALPADSLLYVSNSMPVRHLDAFLPVSRRPLRILSNRGANGIDGMLSSGLGAAAVHAGPAFLLTGDLAFLHDLGGLLAARRHELDLTIVVLNNDGGGIFSFLPISEWGESVGFETLFTTPHGVDLSKATEAFGIEFTRIDASSADRWEALRAEVESAGPGRGTRVVEVPIDRSGAVDDFRELAAIAARAVAGARGGNG